MPQQLQPKYIFIAEGIGITPFRSIIKYLIDKQREEQIVLFYRTSNPAGFIYNELFEEAEKIISLRTVYIVTRETNGWTGETGRIDESIINKYIQYPQTPVYYLSGPQEVIEKYRTMLENLGVDLTHIKTDLFTGYEGY